MTEVLFSFISFLIALGSFIYGAVKLFKKGVPMYFQLLVCSAGCYALEELSAIVTYFCGGFETSVSVGVLGTFAYYLFLLSANFGQLDSIVDDGHSQPNRRARTLAIIAPILSVSMITVVACAAKDVAVTVILTIASLPMPFASYFNLKHLLLPMDDFGFLRATRPCNVIALISYALSFLYTLLMLLDTGIFSDIAYLLFSVNTALLVIFAERGAGQWGI